MSKRGFRVLGEEGTPDALPRYGLTVRFGPRLDYCVLNDSEKYAYVEYEIIDLTNRAVILSVKEPGWTGPCVIRWPTVFDELAEKLAAAWDRGPETPWPR